MGANGFAGERSGGFHAKYRRAKFCCANRCCAEFCCAEFSFAERCRTECA
jgi:hypothetical protein